MNLVRRDFRQDATQSNKEKFVKNRKTLSEEKVGHLRKNS
jgi:hypothetical protein